MNKTTVHTNTLIHETSPYLLQHAHNPVNWYPWGKEALQKAKDENKLMLVSIGYSACHWCHVMERESFEKEEVAEIMNRHFVCIKVDREERPDIDRVYMDAVQLMTGSGGWPLNCFALPDGRPVYGGTYFPEKQWKQVLLQLAELYKNDPDKVKEYAEMLTEGVRKMDLVKPADGPAAFSPDTLNEIIWKWVPQFDNEEGGPNRAPKFPLPNNYRFLLKYYYHTKNKHVFDHVQLTLKKMAYGGIYDQAGGGFARYSTDMLWKAPHFEKMLYDNAQLVTLYCEAYRETKEALYKEVVYETLAFIQREMTSHEGAFYSALDADSEGEEGKFYVWKKEELQSILGSKYDIAAAYFNINRHGLWEHGNYILLRREDDDKVARELNISEEQLKKEIAEIKKILLKEREKRVRPGLDDKSLTSWNAMMMKGYVDAYRTFDEELFLNAALKNARFLAKTQRRSDGGLNHSYKKGKSSINGYLEDYAFTIEALLDLYEATFDEEWLKEAKELAEYAFLHFYDKETGMFFFASDLDDPLIARKMEVTDNVIPASNSTMAKCLHRLGHHFEEEKYISAAKKMLGNVEPYMSSYGQGYSNWAMLFMDFYYPFYEVAVTGKAADEKRKQLDKFYLPNILIAGAASESNLPLLKGRTADKTLIYVCQNKTCKLPVSEVKEALQFIKSPHP